MNYDHKKIEKKWQKKWAETSIYTSKEDSGKEKSFVLDMFPYPSGEGLHVGHPKGYIATDVYSRRKRMQDKSVLHPMGWDAFGLPAENFALKNKVHPRAAVEKNIAHFKSQLEHLGFDYDWSREINTTDPEYYKWTQWIFLKLFEKGLAFQSNEPINWCPTCMTGLANEDLEGGVCERCGTVVERRRLPQWVLRITDYADRLLTDLETLPGWPDHIKELQKNWIGRSEGAEIEFALNGREEKITVFTTRADTLFGATYLVLAPEHPLIPTLKDSIKNWHDVLHYISEASTKSEIERTAEGKEKTGVEIQGVTALNPATHGEIPIYIADYVLGGYGTGAIMAVPAHDERDFEFAEKFNIPVREVIEKGESLTPYTGAGKLINSDSFDGIESEIARTQMTEKFGRAKVSYKLRDWVFSRQRYWGEPIPIIHCEKCGAVAVPEKDLPVRLPDVEKYEPSGTGESPLAAITEWVNTTCPKCGGAGKRETNTMPQWAGSSWYYLRYMDPHDDKAAVAPEREKYWAPVDMYVGGAEHATRHLIYARFWHKFLYDIGIVSTLEPFASLHSVGLIIAEDGRKMSKRFGNVLNPDDIVDTYGADTLRVYEMFMGPFENAIAWNTQSLIGARRFIERVWRLEEKLGKGEPSAEFERLFHQTVKKVGEDIEAFKFNTAISQMMIFLNAAEKGGLSTEQWKAFLQLLAPFAPHVTEELWERLGENYSVHTSQWPQFDASKLIGGVQRIVVQVNGRVRANIEIEQKTSESEVEALARESIKERLIGKEPKRVIVVPGKLVNFVLEE